MLIAISRGQRERFDIVYQNSAPCKRMNTYFWNVVVTTNVQVLILLFILRGFLVSLMNQTSHRLQVWCDSECLRDCPNQKNLWFVIFAENVTKVTSRGQLSDMFDQLWKFGTRTVCFCYVWQFPEYISLSHLFFPHLCPSELGSWRQGALSQSCCVFIYVSI